MAKRHFLSPKEKAELGMIKSKPTPQKGSPEYKLEKLKNWTWGLLIGSVILALLGIFATWSQANVPALGFGKLGKYFWIPLVCSIVPIAAVITSIILSRKKAHYLTQLIFSCIAVVGLLAASLFFGVLGSVYTDGERIANYAQSVCGRDLKIDETDTYTLELEDGIKATYYARDDFAPWPDIPLSNGMNDNNYLSMSNFSLDTVPSFTYYHESALYNVTTGEWINSYTQLAAGNYNLILFIENYNNDAGIIITGITLKVW